MIDFFRAALHKRFNYHDVQNVRSSLLNSTHPIGIGSDIAFDHDNKSDRLTAIYSVSDDTWGIKLHIRPMGEPIPLSQSVERISDYDKVVVGNHRKDVKHEMLYATHSLAWDLINQLGCHVKANLVL